jgi:cation diffusion facilitator family transporter
VLVALGANLGIAILKLVAGLLTGSAAMLAESAHSLADTTTQALLLTALRRSDRKADRRHPFGYGKERFFWALIAAVSIFVSGGLFSVFEGVRTILTPEPLGSGIWVAYAVLGLAFLMEGTSLVRALLQVRSEARSEGISVRQVIRETDDPTVKTVVFEDSSALVGVLLAFAGVALQQLTGSAVWDGVASVLIGLLLAGLAYVLGSTNKALLIGQQAEPRLVQAVRDALSERPEVLEVVDLLTMTVGTDQVLVCARIDFRDEMTSSDVEEACVEIDVDLRHRFHDVEQIFLEPVPRTNDVMRERVLDRYGRHGVDGIGDGAPTG